MNSQLPAFTAENIELTARLEQLRLEFLELFTRHKDMVENDAALLTSVYLEKLGRFQLELMQKQTEAARLKMKMNLIQAAINRDERPDLLAIEEKLRAQLKSYYEQIEAQAKAIDEAKRLLSVLLPDEETKKLKEVFRVLCKRLHPDLNPNLTDDEKDLFVRVKTAYELQDLAELQKILLYLDGSAKENIKLVSADEKLERIKNLEKNITALNNKISLLKQNFPFNIEDLIFDEKYICQRREEIGSRIKTAEEEIVKYTNIIKIMIDE